MTLEHCKQYNEAEAFNHWAEGGRIQERHVNGGGWYDVPSNEYPSEHPAWTNSYTHRIKPQPKTVDLEPDDFIPPTRLRHPNRPPGSWSDVIEICAPNALVVSVGGIGLAVMFTDLRRDGWLYSQYIDGKWTDWKRCEKEVE